MPLFLTLSDKALRLEERLLMLLVLGPEGVIITISDLESFNCRKFLDIQFLISARQDMKQVIMRIIHITMKVDIMSAHDLPQG